MAGSEEDHGGVPVDHKQQIPRLRRIEGQVRGVQHALVQSSVAGGLPEAERQRLADEVGSLIARIV